MMIAQARIALEDAVRVKSAEYWLILGEPTEALRELEKLSRRARTHPWAERALVLVADALGPLHEHGVSEGANGQA